MGNLCFKGDDSDGENNYLAGGQRVSGIDWRARLAISVTERSLIALLVSI